MTPQAVLGELLNRLKASQGAAVHISEGELSEWPVHSVAALKSARLLVKARPASSLICPGCEEHCPGKPVDVYPEEGGRPARAYIHCDEPRDEGRITIEQATLEQWRVKGDASPAAVARALGVPLQAAKAGAQPSRQSGRDAAIRAKYEELARGGKRNYVKEIKRTVQGADSLDARSIRRIVHGR